MALTEENRCKWMYQLLKALQYVHSRRVVHRDIKPDNLLVDRHGDIKLGDFGLARTLYCADEDVDIDEATLTSMRLRMAHGVCKAPGVALAWRAVLPNYCRFLDIHAKKAWIYLDRTQSRIHLSRSLAMTARSSGVFFRPKIPIPRPPPHPPVPPKIGAGDFIPPPAPSACHHRTSQPPMAAPLGV